MRLPLARTLTTGVIIVAIGAAGLLAFFCKPQSRAGRAGFFGFRLMGLLGVLYWPQRPAQAGVQAAGSVVFERAMYALAGVCFMVRPPMRRAMQPADALHWAVRSCMRRWASCMPLESLLRGHPLRAS